MIKKVFTYLASIISLSTILLYYLGKGYHLGFIKEFGISPNLFPMSLPKYVYVGFMHPFMSFLNWITLPLLNVIGTLFVFLLLIALVIIINERKGFLYSFMSWSLKIWENKIISKRGINNKRNKKFDKHINRLVDSTLKIFYSLLGIIIFLVLVISLADSSYKDGRAEAERIKENYSEVKSDKGYYSYEFVSIEQDTRKFEGLILKYSDNYILAYNNEKEAVIFNNTSIDKIINLTSP